MLSNSFSIFSVHSKKRSHSCFLFLASEKSRIEYLDNQIKKLLEGIFSLKSLLLTIRKDIESLLLPYVSKFVGGKLISGLQSNRSRISWTDQILSLANNCHKPSRSSKEIPFHVQVLSSYINI